MSRHVAIMQLQPWCSSRECAKEKSPRKLYQQGLLRCIGGMSSGSPSPTRRMRWEGSKGTVGAGVGYGGPRVVGGGPRF